MLLILLGGLLLAVLWAVMSVHADLKARDQTPLPPDPQAGVWPPPPTDHGGR